jgi:hypothetical protein
MDDIGLGVFIHIETAWAGRASGNHFHFNFTHHHLTLDQPRPHTSSMIFSLGSPTSVLSGRDRGSRQRLSPTQHTGQSVRRGFLILC